MAWTQADIDALKQAIVDRKGARTITFSEQSVTFETIEQMRMLLADMAADVAVSGNRSRTRFAATRKGV
jgi:hypothetical protein